VCAGLALIALGNVLAPDTVQRGADFWTEPLLPETISELEPSTDRPTYAYSVVPGGVFDEGELAKALEQDPVVAEHYGAVDPQAFHAEKVAEDRLVYVSYRKDDQVYWTRNKVRLHKDEAILTDGKNEIRARCGNKISDSPVAPVADSEPDPIELDRLIADDTDPNSSALLASAPNPNGPGAGVLGPGPERQPA
jgi:hypothetical protein